MVMATATSTSCYSYSYAPVPWRFPSRLLVTSLLAIKFSYGFMLPLSQSQPDSSCATQHDCKRFAIAATLAIAPFMGWEAHNPIMVPPPAHALLEKNEILCNTGFFTNVGAWYCTDIGNIGDEGKPKPLSEDAETSVDSLISKFDLVGVDSTAKAGKHLDQANENSENKEIAK